MTGTASEAKTSKPLNLTRQESLIKFISTCLINEEKKKGPIAGVRGWFFGRIFPIGPLRSALRFSGMHREEKSAGDCLGPRDVLE
jgi:hypothetical protein